MVMICDMEKGTDIYRDFYVSVIDNYGDMGFAVNFAFSLHKKSPNCVIRFFSDDQNLFRKFFPDYIPDWIEYRELEVLYQVNPITPAKLIFSFFDYKIPAEYLANFLYEKTIVVFSYFLLHEGLGSLHGTTYTLDSGYDKVVHYIPSLLPEGGGIIINPAIEKKRDLKWEFFSGIGKDVSERKWVSIFVYKETLPEILSEIKKDTSGTIYWICGNDLISQESYNCRFLPFLSLEDYGKIQYLCDVNIVRGENSLCQGLLAGKPILWDIYKEKNNAHKEKIEDFILFLWSFLPENFSQKYAQIFRSFNNENIGNSFREYIEISEEFMEVFKDIGQYMKKECDLLEKLDKMLG